MLKLRPLSTVKSQQVILALEGDGCATREEEDVAGFGEDLGACLVGDGAAALEDDLDLVVGVCVHEGGALLHAEEAACYGLVCCCCYDVFWGG